MELAGPVLGEGAGAQAFLERPVAAGSCTRARLAQSLFCARRRGAQSALLAMRRKTRRRRQRFLKKHGYGRKNRSVTESKRNATPAFQRHRPRFHHGAGRRAASSLAAMSGGDDAYSNGFADAATRRHGAASALGSACQGTRRAPARPKSMGVIICPAAWRSA